MINVSKIRKDFPILSRKINGKRLVYLDNAATSQKPSSVINAVKEFYENFNSNVHRSVYKLAEEATDMYEGARQATAKFVNAGADEIIFVRNATEALNLIAYSWGMHNIQRGDEILITEMEHHSNILPWQMVAKAKGAKLVYTNVKDFMLDMKDFENKLTKKTKLVIMTHVSNVLGTINDVKVISKLVHDNNSLFAVDGAQAVPHMKVDMKSIDADFYAFSGHKMLGPHIGVLYGKKHILDATEPFIRGGSMIKDVTPQDAEWNDVPWKFEAGTPMIAEAVGLHEAVKYLQKLGMDNIRKHEAEITSYALSKMKGIQIFGPRTNRGGIISFNIDRVHPHDVSQVLDNEGVCIRGGHHCAKPLMRAIGTDSVSRASFYIYNDKDDVDVFVKAIEKVKKMFAK
ncbi:MAG: cysteine desulfurase [Candidatus Aenigmarchaeota archaeon]|nr:cysteine desulfurase [Candidatus Aenigmarchaeota archaeon]MDI6722474.1 cysteine desulfurase [Candidatus Aenigmarchaeota archaeon]